MGRRRFPLFQADTFVAPPFRSGPVGLPSGRSSFTFFFFPPGSISQILPMTEPFFFSFLRSKPPVRDVPARMTEKIELADFINTIFLRTFFRYAASRGSFFFFLPLDVEHSVVYFFLPLEQVFPPHPQRADGKKIATNLPLSPPSFFFSRQPSAATGSFSSTIRSRSFSFFSLELTLSFSFLARQIMENPLFPRSSGAQAFPRHGEDEAGRFFQNRDLWRAQVLSEHPTSSSHTFSGRDIIFPPLAYGSSP